jgi:hypothetical protein
LLVESSEEHVKWRRGAVFRLDYIIILSIEGRGLAMLAVIRSAETCIINLSTSQTILPRHRMISRVNSNLPIKKESKFEDAAAIRSSERDLNNKSVDAAELRREIA